MTDTREEMLAAITAARISYTLGALPLADAAALLDRAAAFLSTPTPEEVRHDAALAEETDK